MYEGFDVGPLRDDLIERMPCYPATDAHSPVTRRASSSAAFVGNLEIAASACPRSFEKKPPPDAVCLPAAGGEAVLLVMTVKLRYNWSRDKKQLLHIGLLEVAASAKL